MYRNLLKNISLISIGTLASKLIVYLMIPLYTNVLTTEEYGITDLIFTTSSLIMPLLSLEISNSLMRFLLDKEYNKKQVFDTSFTILSISVVFFLAFSPVFALNKLLSDYFLLFIFYYVTNQFNGFMQSYARGINLIKDYSIAGIIQTCFVIVLNILLLLVFNQGILGYLIAYSSGALASSLYLVFIAKRKAALSFTIKNANKRLAVELLKYSVPLIPNSVLWWISNSSNKYILTFFLGTSEVGIYSVAYKIPTILSVFSSVFITAWQISSVENFGSEKTTKFFRDVTQKYFYFNVLCTSGIILLLKPICSFLFSKDFYQAWHVVPIILIGYIFYTMSIFYGTVYTASKKTKMVLISTFLGSLLNIILSFILIPKFKIHGAAIATGISYIIIYYMRKFDSKRIVDLKIGGIDIVYTFVLFLQSLAIYIDNMVLNIFSFIIILILSTKSFNKEFYKLFIKIKKGH